MSQPVLMFEAAKEAALEAIARRKALVQEMVEDLAEGIMVLKVRDGMSISRDQATERARNVMARWVLKYKFERMW